MSRLVDDATLERWRSLDALFVLARLDCYAKRDITYHPTKANKTSRYHVSANGRDWELLLTGPKFWDTRAEKGGGGAIDLTMHLFGLDFKRALRKLNLVLSPSPLEAQDEPLQDDSLGRMSGLARRAHGTP